MDTNVKSQENIIEQALRSIKNNLLEIENRNDLSEEEKVGRVIKVISATCAGAAIQPIPFADIFVLTPIQAFMGARIAAIRGIPVSESKAREIVLEIASVVGMGFLAQQLVIGAYKTVLPFLGAVTTVPLVFGLTYAMGRVMDEYFVRKHKGHRIDKVEMKELWKTAMKQGKAMGKENKNEIIKNSQDKGDDA